MNENDETKNVDPVPYFIHEGVVARMSECNKRLLIALVIAVIAMLLNNLVWIVYEGVTHSAQQGIVYEQEADS